MSSAPTEAESRYFGWKGVAAAGAPKELFLIEGATHADLCDKDEFVGPAVTKPKEVYSEYLA